MRARWLALDQHLHVPSGSLKSCITVPMGPTAENVVGVGSLVLALLSGEEDLLLAVHRLVGALNQRSRPTKKAATPLREHG